MIQLTTKETDLLCVVWSRFSTDSLDTDRIAMLSKLEKLGLIERQWVITEAGSKFLDIKEER